MYDEIWDHKVLVLFCFKKTISVQLKKSSPARRYICYLPFHTVVLPVQAIFAISDGPRCDSVSLRRIFFDFALVEDTEPATTGIAVLLLLAHLPNPTYLHPHIFIDLSLG